MLELLDTGSPRHKLSKDFKPIKKIFKHCGDIRNAYINLEIGVRYQLKNEEFIMHQLAIIENGTKEVQELGGAYLKIIKTARHDISDDIRTVEDESILEFYRTTLTAITIAMDTLQFNEELHAARKQIKTLMYNRKIAHQALDGKLQINNDYLDKLQDRIGDWHDNLLALELFSTTQLGNQPVLTKIKRQNTRLKRSIAVLVQDFEKKAILAGTLV